MLPALRDLGKEIGGDKEPIALRRIGRWLADHPDRLYPDLVPTGDNPVHPNVVARLLNLREAGNEARTACNAACALEDVNQRRGTPRRSHLDYLLAKQALRDVRDTQIAEAWSLVKDMKSAVNRWDEDSWDERAAWREQAAEERTRHLEAIEHERRREQNRNEFGGRPPQTVLETRKRD